MILLFVLCQQYRSRDRLPPNMSYHSSLDDTLIISSSLAESSMISIRPVDNKEVIVDLQCGLAVMRGADIYAPGVMSASQG